MTLSQWRALFPPRILQRGLDYYADGRVQLLSREDNRVSAVVSGTEQYHVELDLERGLIAQWSCDCPYGADGTPCKHLAALLRQLEEADRKDGPLPLEELVAGLSGHQARALLLRLAAEHRDATALIRSVAENPSSRWDP